MTLKKWPNLSAEGRKHAAVLTRRLVTCSDGRGRYKCSLRQVSARRYGRQRFSGVLPVEGNKVIAVEKKSATAQHEDISSCPGRAAFSFLFLHVANATLCSAQLLLSVDASSRAAAAAVAAAPRGSGGTAAREALRAAFHKEKKKKKKGGVGGKYGALGKAV